MNLALQSGHQRGIFMVLLGAVFFSTKGIFAKLAYRYGVDAIAILNLRMLFSLPFYIVIYYRESLKKSIKISQTDKKDILIIGLIGYYLAALFDFKGLEYISANLERIVIFTYPTFVLLLGFLIYKRKITNTQILAVVICYLGILCSFLSDIKSIDIKSSLIGIGFVLLSSLTYAFYLVRSDSIISRIGTLRFTCISMIISCVAVLLHNFIKNGFDLLSFSMPIYILGFTIAVVSTVLPSFLMTYGISLIGSSNMSIIASVGPVSTLFLAYFILGEPITLLHITGTLLVLIGVYTISKKV